MPNYTAETHYLDVGQGDCSIIVVKEISRYKDKFAKFDPQIVRTVLIDCGSRGTPDDELTQSENYNSPGNILLRKLESLRIEYIDILIISHFDEDHFKGIIEICNSGEFAKQKYFMKCNIYDMGNIYAYTQTFETSETTFSDYLGSGSAGSWENNYTLYTQGLKSVSNLPGATIKRHTERVYCGNPENFSKGIPGTKYLTRQPPNNFSSTLTAEAEIWNPIEVIEEEANHFLHNGVYKIDFDACHHLIGKDLLNDAYEYEEIPDMNLWCLAANGWKYDPENDAEIDLKVTSHQDNNFSLGVLLKFKNYTAWFGGDLNKKVENQLTDSILYYTTRGLSVLKCAHHGGNTSTDKIFLDRLKPYVAVITCGEAGKHSHPSVEVIENLANDANVKLVTVTGFGVSENDPKRSRNWSQETRIKEYAKHGFPTYFTQPFDRNNKFHVPGASWEGELSDVLIKRVASRGNGVWFRCFFYSAFKGLVVSDLKKSNRRLNNQQVLQLLETKANLLDGTYLQPEITHDNETDHMHVEWRHKRKRTDDSDPDMLPGEPVKKQRIQMIGEDVKFDFNHEFPNE